ncbi:MAG: hypothetical protein BJ554DRAFT_838, partial [Olpidium bornovanus]
RRAGGHFREHVRPVGGELGRPPCFPRRRSSGHAFQELGPLERPRGRLLGVLDVRAVFVQRAKRRGHGRKSERGSRARTLRGGGGRAAGGPGHIPPPSVPPVLAVK